MMNTAVQFWYFERLDRKQIRNCIYWLRKYPSAVVGVVDIISNELNFLLKIEFIWNNVYDTRCASASSRSSARFRVTARSAVCTTCFNIKNSLIWNLLTVESQLSDLKGADWWSDYPECRIIRKLVEKLISKKFWIHLRILLVFMPNW